MTLQHGQTYLNKRGDFRQIEERTPGMFLDQYGTGYYPDGRQWDHAPASTGNIDLSTAGVDPEFDAACQREEDDRADEAELYREAGL